jgi:DNA-binding CsgD family transcriptional regulator
MACPPLRIKGQETAATVLTPRELEIAGLVAQGLTNRDIDGRLVISERTAATHIEHILAKLGLQRRGQIAAWAAQEGIRTAGVAG